KVARDLVLPNFEPGSRPKVGITNEAAKRGQFCRLYGLQQVKKFGVVRIGDLKCICQAQCAAALTAVDSSEPDLHSRAPADDAYALFVAIMAKLDPTTSLFPRLSYHAGHIVDCGRTFAEVIDRVLDLRPFGEAWILEQFHRSYPPVSLNDNEKLAFGDNQ